MKKILLILLVFISVNLWSQEDSLSVKEPIVYGDISIGRFMGSYDGLSLGLEVNYQLKHEKLLSLYFQNASKYKMGLIVFIIPVIEFVNSTNETGAMLGKRWVWEQSSLSISGGLSYNLYREKKYNTSDNSNDNDVKIYEENYVGVPINLTYIFFKPERSRYKLFHFIPVGQPSSLSRNFGVELHANLSKRSYIGMSLVFGFGVHKNYN